MADNAIILCGFMGCGKSTVGKTLARLLDREFIDMDEYIEQKAGMTVSQIFESQGEAVFRAMERDACRELSQKKNCVVASGGGALTFDENVRVFHGAECPIVLLDVPLSVILQRLQNDTTRPLLQRPDKEQAAQQLYNKRLPVYRSAATLTVAGTDSAQIAKRIAEAVGA